MPTWIYGRPIDDPAHPPNEAELKVAQILASLNEQFVVVWTFFYSDEHGARQGEGDFLILGPDGNLLHMEVKSGPVTHNPRTGRFQTADGENPIEQRDKIWGALVDTLKRQASQMSFNEPYVDRVVALPDVEIPLGTTAYQTMPRDGLIDSTDLAKFTDWWKERFIRNRYQDPEARRDVFFAVFGSGGKPPLTRIMLDFADQLIKRHSDTNFELLDAIEENHQLMFDGGPGTGKTWLALEKAFRWAREGKRILLLTYNLELERALATVVHRKGLKEKIIVHSYESLSKRLYEEAGRDYPNADIADRSNRETLQWIFDVELPNTLLEIVASLKADQKFDALVVDEAQDHNTTFHPDVMADPLSPGWWTIYAGLLREGFDSPVALFFDKGQRHFARGGNLFDPARLEASFARAMRVRLRHTVRYTHQLIDFFINLRSPETEDLLRDMRGNKEAPQGPDPLFLKASRSGDEKAVVGKLVGDWCKNKKCEPNDILILYPTSAARPVWIDNEKINGVPIAKPGVPGTGLRCSSVHKAKGLEAQGVVLVGFPPWARLQEPGAVPGSSVTYFMGVTRARMLLAIVERSDLNPAELKVI